MFSFCDFVHVGARLPTKLQTLGYFCCNIVKCSCRFSAGRQRETHFEPFVQLNFIFEPELDLISIFFIFIFNSIFEINLD